MIYFSYCHIFFKNANSHRRIKRPSIHVLQRDFVESTCFMASFGNSQNVRVTGKGLPELKVGIVTGDKAVTTWESQA